MPKLQSREPFRPEVLRVAAAHHCLPRAPIVASPTNRTRTFAAAVAGQSEACPLIRSLCNHLGPPAPRQDAERRQLTVLFCDLVGSTALSQQLDPEQLRELMRVYQEACRQVIETYDGHVAQYLGDGLMVYFGWPHAHEDDAERAVRTSLEIIEAVKHVTAPAPLHVRIGIATGSVVVGETGAGDASVANVAVGETPNLAARLQVLAGSDEIIIGPSTRQLAGGVFRYADLGKRNLKGILEPMQAWQITGLSEAEGRFEARGAHLIALVGREDEVAILTRRWAQTQAGEGQVVLLSGEPGIGKSRLTQVLSGHIAGELHYRLRYQCSPHRVNSAFYPIIEHLTRAAKFTSEDSAAAKLAKLEASLALSKSSYPHSVQLIAALLSIPTPELPAPNYPLQKRKKRRPSKRSRRRSSVWLPKLPSCCSSKMPIGSTPPAWRPSSNSFSTPPTSACCCW